MVRTGFLMSVIAVFSFLSVFHLASSLAQTQTFFGLPHTPLGSAQLSLDAGGNPIGEPTRFVIGVALNPSAVDAERELRRLYWKVDAGAEFAVTQPVFDPRQLEAFLERTAEFDIPVVAGIWPLVSLGNAEFLANEVPGQHVPDTVIARMRKAQERGKVSARAEGIAIAREVMASIGNAVSGVHVSAPFGKVEVALKVLES